MIYLFDQVANFSAENYLGYLSKGRRKQYDAYKFKINKDMCAVAFLLLRLGLLKEYGIKLEENTEIGYGKYGKPYLKKYKDIYFNFSHRKECVVCAISEYEIGVDVEALLGEAYFKMVNDILSLNEMIEFMKAENKGDILTKFWTLKECYIKQNGKGLFQNLQLLDFSNIQERDFQLYNKYFITRKYKDYRISVCSKIPIKENEIKNITNFDIY